MLLDERIQSELSSLYPNGIITSLSTTNVSLYYEIKRIAERKNISNAQYIESLGFTYERKRRNKKNTNDKKLEDIMVGLMAAFPDKKIQNFASHPLYGQLYYLCKQINVDMNDFLNQQGFHYKNISGQIKTQQNVVEIDKNKFKYDVDTMRTLCTTYGLNQKVFSDLFEISRQAISNIINRKNKYSNNWVTTELDQDTLSTFVQMIADYEKEYLTENEQFFINSDGNIENPNFCFFYTLKIENEVLCQCLYDLPDVLKEELFERKFHLFNAPQLHFIKELRKQDQIHASKNQTYYLTPEERKIVNVIIKKNNHLFLDFFEFQELVGLKKIAYMKDKKEVMDKRYYDLLSSYYVPELDIVKIPIGDRDYLNIQRAAGRRGVGIKEFIESFGFNYKRVVNINLEERKEKYLNILAPYILDDGKIYLSSSDPVYTRLYILAYKSNRTLTEYLKEEFDLDRYIHINDVPSYLTPKIEKVTYTEAKEDMLIEKIMEYFLVDEELKTVYIPTTSGFYMVIYKYCDSLDRDMDEVLSSWGFTRLKKYQLSIQEEVFIPENLVEELSNIQTSINTEETEVKRQKRSQRLVNLLKELYDYKCQICGDSPVIPIIPMENGKNYVEVHHIVPLHNQNVMNDESDYVLDDYENAIVVCAHHHKVLHYENGGYLDIQKLNDDFYFVRDANKIHIQKNYHLEENDHLVSKLINTIRMM